MYIGSRLVGVRPKTVDFSTCTVGPETEEAHPSSFVLVLTTVIIIIMILIIIPGLMFMGLSS